MFQSLRDIDQDLEPAKDTEDLDTVIEMMKEPEDKMPPEDLFFLDKTGTAESQVSKYYPLMGQLQQKSSAFLIC